jgi:hypothetical protein
MDSCGLDPLIDWSYGEDRDEVTGAETVVAGGVSPSPVDPLCPVESGQGDRFCHIGVSDGVKGESIELFSVPAPEVAPDVRPRPPRR